MRVGTAGMIVWTGSGRVHRLKVSKPWLARETKGRGALECIPNQPLSQSLMSVGGRFRWRLYNLTAAAASPSLLDGVLLGRRLKRSTLASCSARFRIMEPYARLFKLERTP